MKTPEKIMRTLATILQSMVSWLIYQCVIMACFRFLSTVISSTGRNFELAVQFLNYDHSGWR